MANTAMQDLIDYFNKNGFTVNEISVSVLDNYFTELLAKEKQQIIDAFECFPFHSTGEDYYNQTYNQEQKHK